MANTSVSPVGSWSVSLNAEAVSGPLFVTRTVKMMTSPTFGVGLLTVLVTDRSACCGASLTVAVLLLGSGSNWSARPTVAVLLLGFGLVTVAAISKVCGVPGLTVPATHRPVLGS